MLIRRDRISYTILTHLMDAFSYPPLNFAFVLKLPEFPTYTEMHINVMIYYTIIDFNEVDIRIYLPDKVIIHQSR